MGTEEVAGRWGTWEELLLGGAVLRHGTRDWNLIAAELRTRTASPFEFTPEVCKAKYEDLQQRFSGCSPWFEELRRQRMAELKRALEQSEDSIGSLESKIESMMSERRNDSIPAYDSSRTESPVTSQKYERMESSSKDTFKDGLSAGSFTQDVQTKWAPECQISPAVPSEEIDAEPEVSQSSKINKLSDVGTIADAICGQLPSLRKRRGKRKRKYISGDVKECSIGESQMPHSADVASTSLFKATSADDASQIARSSAKDGQGSNLSKDMMNNLMRIFNSVAENQCASVFRRRLDSQKRGRYKRIVRRHMDFDTIKSRIASHSIKSMKELFRDLLLVANNALVFYSKCTREYKSALLLRYTITISLRQLLKDDAGEATAATLSSSSPKRMPPSKPRSLRPGHQKLPGKVSNVVNAITGTSHGCRTLDAPSPPSMESVENTQKGISRLKNVVRRRGRGTQISETSTKGKKRIRTR